MEGHLKWVEFAMLAAVLMMQSHAKPVTLNSASRTCITPEVDQHLNAQLFLQPRQALLFKQTNSVTI